MNKPAKEAKEHVARAKAYAAKPDAVRALSSCCEAIRGMVQGQVVGRERYEIEILLSEVLRLVSRLDEVKRTYDKPLAYAKGQDKKLYVQLSEIQKKIQEARDKEALDATRARKNKIDQLVLKAQELLVQGQPMEAKKVIRLVTEQYGDEPGIFADVGRRMAVMGLTNEAVEYLERAVELNPKDSRPYPYLANAYEELGRLDDLERFLRDALKQFGRNARIFARLAKLFRSTRRWSDAYEMARLAVDSDPNLNEAKRILAEMERRVFGSSMSA